MAFEPTIGFSNLTDIDYDIELAANDPQVPEMNEQNKPEEEQSEKPVEKAKQFDLGSFFSPITSWLNANKWMIFTGILIVALVVWSLYHSRVKWLPKVLVRKYRTETDDWVTFVKRYKSLLKQLDRLGLKRSAGMTLNDYAVHVDAHFGGNQMGVLTAAYEKGLYGSNTTGHDWAFLKEMWEDLINRASG